MPGTTTLTAAAAVDESFLLSLYLRGRREEVAAWGWGERELESFLRMQFLARQGSYRAQYPDAAVFIIRQDGIPVGSLTLARRPTEILLLDLAIVPEHQGRGIGGGQVGRLVAEAAENGAVLRLSVLKGNRAVALYERLGLRVVADHGAYVAMATAGPA